MTSRQAIVSFAFLLLGLAACDNPAPSSPMAPTPTLPTVSSVTIGGLPSSFTIGQSVQLKASVTLPDGSRLDATSKVTWQSSDAKVATVSTTGLLLVAGPGDADVTATVQNVRATAHVSVLKPVTSPVLYDIDGVVHETAPTEDIGVPGTTVGIHFVGCPTCPNDNQSTVTDDKGRFLLPGIVTAGFQLVASRPGYDVASYGIVTLPRDQHAAIALSPSSLVMHETFGGDCRDIVMAGSATTRFAVHHDGVLVGDLYFGPTWEGGENRLDYRRVTGTTEAFVDFPLFTNIAIRGGFFYEIRVSWLGACERRFELEFSHPN